MDMFIKANQECFTGLHYVLCESQDMLTDVIHYHSVGSYNLCCSFFRNCLFILFILYVTFKLVFLNRLVIYLVCLPMYLKEIIFFSPVFLAFCGVISVGLLWRCLRYWYNDSRKSKVVCFIFQLFIG